jgi:AcrR family transcriptional regulator
MPPTKKSGRAGLHARPVKASGKRGHGSSLPLTRQHIVSTAMAVVDRDGLKALSMRRLGAELGVDPMAVYYHIPNKEALLDAIVEAVMAGIDLSIDNPAHSCEERALAAARAYRDALLAHVNALPIVLQRGPATPVALRPVEVLLGILRDAGLPPAQALAGMNLIAAAVRGAVGMGPAPEGSEHPTAEQIEAMARSFPVGEFPNLIASLPYAGDFMERGFDFGVRVIVRGLLGELQSGGRG